MTKWDQRFMDMARLVAGWSKDPSTQVGAVITRGKYIVSVGFNGHPAGVEDTTERLQVRETKYRTIVHAELNAILTARQSLAGCCIYVWPFMPCSQCAASVIQVGITRVVAPLNNAERWAESFNFTRQIFQEAAVELHEVA